MEGWREGAREGQRQTHTHEQTRTHMTYSLYPDMTLPWLMCLLFHDSLPGLRKVAISEMGIFS